MAPSRSYETQLLRELLHRVIEEGWVVIPRGRLLRLLDKGNEARGTMVALLDQWEEVSGARSGLHHIRLPNQSFLFLHARSAQISDQ